MKQISFSAGCGDPNRTIWQKYRDYETIDKMMSKLNNRNLQLEHILSDLGARRHSLIELFNNVLEMDEEEIKARLKELDSQIESIKNEIENNKNIIRSLWYGYHERI